MPRVQVFADEEALSRAAAELFAQTATAAVAGHGHCAVLLAGGETPRRAYELLAEAPLASRIPWPRVHVFWGDERCLPADDPRRNEVMAHQALLDRVPLDPAHLHPIRCHPAPEQAAAAYEAELRQFFGRNPPRFDLVFLGLGTDGHTASLLPASSALAAQRDWAAVTSRPEEPFSRVTLTAPLLNQAALAVFLVTGGNKAKTLRAVLTGHQPPLPAQLIVPQQGQLLWLVDREAASLWEKTENAAP